MTPLDYDYLRKLLRERSGLVLSADKQYLVESRLLPVARRAGSAGLAELVLELKRGARAEPLAVDVVEAMTTNESFFFRDKLPFEHFRDTIDPGADGGARERAPAANLVRRRLDRPGAVFARHVSAGDGAAARRLAHRDRRQPTCPATCWTRPGPASTASSRCSAACRSRFLIKYFTRDRRHLADRARHPRHGAVPSAQSARGLQPSRHVRRGVLPQRADLFRPGDQDQRARPHRRG